MTFPDDTSKVYTTDKDGLILIKDVPYGTYTIQEVNAPDIYVPDTKIETVTLDDENSDGQTITFHKVNKLKKGYIEVHKQDTSDGTGIKDVVLQLYSKKDDSLVETLITDEVGYAKSSLIPLGSYYIVEKGANNGIIIDPEAKDIELTDSQLDGDYYYTNVYLKNDVVKAKVRIYKECDVVKGFDVDTMTFEYEKARIGGMKFQIIASEDIKDLRNDEVIYSKGEIVYSGVCDNDGSKYVSLPVGDYIVKEVENPEGTILNSKEYSIHLSANDNVTQVIEETVVIVNERQCIDITVNKKDDQGLGLSGSVFGVYTKDDFLDASGNIVVEKNTMVGMIEPSPSGSISDLPYGQYYIKEIKAPKGFYLDDMQYDVCVEFDKNAQGYQKTLDIVNVAKKGNIQVYKYNPINQLNYPIEGVEFSVKASQDIINPTDGKVLFAKGYDFGTIVTNNQGIAVIEDLYPGEYVLVETHNPHLGYILDSTEHKVILKEDETVD